MVIIIFYMYLNFINVSRSNLRESICMKYFCDQFKVRSAKKTTHSHCSSLLCLVFSKITNCSVRCVSVFNVKVPIIRMFYIFVWYLQITNSKFAVHLFSSDIRGSQSSNSRKSYSSIKEVLVPLMQGQKRVEEELKTINNRLAVMCRDQRVNADNAVGSKEWIALAIILLLGQLVVGFVFRWKGH